ncbi:TetR/AcrR family transcriptional regulator [Nocardia brasiliensis]|uniref:TetR/AcrR family transcriptional regulator n=1 Tax=Nocardia brasiliensis TaxID=37326 RepID=UPI00189371F3|nr:TetR/AcrR family transcriptional regulator C-terminal domain-containing protein [Nocardia brasiliensis]MBF6546150.1 TetR/AcrR family transcriptional regulator C-terminal domain-containing protein [Nocardia brasiliensis]
MPRPRSLTTADLANAALAVLDRDGLAALTMRAVAKELGVATMALYRYVADREALEVLVVDHIYAAIDTTSPPAAPWQEALTALLDRVRAAVARHPETVPLVLRHRQSSPASLRVIEAMLAVLTRAGFTGPDRVIAQRTLVAFLLGALQNEHYAALSGRGTATMAALDPETFPLLADTATQARTVTPDDEYRTGLQIVLRGLTSFR